MKRTQLPSETETVSKSKRHKSAAVVEEVSCQNLDNQQNPQNRKQTIRSILLLWLPDVLITLVWGYMNEFMGQLFHHEHFYSTAFFQMSLVPGSAHQHLYANRASDCRVLCWPRTSSSSSAAFEHCPDASFSLSPLYRRFLQVSYLLVHQRYGIFVAAREQRSEVTHYALDGKTVLGQMVLKGPCCGLAFSEPQLFCLEGEPHLYMSNDVSEKVHSTLIICDAVTLRRLSSTKVKHVWSPLDIYNPWQSWRIRSILAQPVFDVNKWYLVTACCKQSVVSVYKRVPSHAEEQSESLVLHAEIDGGQNGWRPEAVVLAQDSDACYIYDADGYSIITYDLVDLVSSGSIPLPAAHTCDIPSTKLRRPVMDGDRERVASMTLTPSGTLLVAREVLFQNVAREWKGTSLLTEIQ